MKSFLDSVTDSVRATLSAEQMRSAELPIFPLGSVLFPGGTMALRIFEQRYLEMVKTCLKADAPFGIALIREGDEVGIPAVPEAVGTLAHIIEWDMQELGILQIRVRGGKRFRLLSRSPLKSGLIIGQISMLADDVHSDCPEHKACAHFLRKVLMQVGATGKPTEQQFDDAGWVGYRVTELLPFNSAIKQKMLELTDARMRLEILHRFLADQRLIE